MHALYIACIYQIYFVFKEYGECYSSKERRGILYFVPCVSLFLPISCLKRQRDLFCVHCCTSNLWNSRGGWWNRPYSFNIMGPKMKGLYKAGFKYITSIFVVKERELEIGCPTDVKHVAHIGWEGSSGTAPTWMKGFKTGPEFAATTIGNNGSSLSPWSTQDFAETKGAKKADDVCKKDRNSGELPNIHKPRQKRKKSRSNSSSKSGSSSSSSRASRSSAKSKSKFIDGNNKPIKVEAEAIDIEVA